MSFFHLSVVFVFGWNCFIFGELKIANFRSLIEWVTWCRYRISRVTVAHFHLVHARLTRFLFRSVFFTHPPLPLEDRGVVFCLSFVFPSPYVEIVSLITPLSMTNNCVSFIVCSACFRAELSTNNDNFITVLFHCTLALGFKFFFKKYW